jgi:hypothetical protein
VFFQYDERVLARRTLICASVCLAHFLPYSSWRRHQTPESSSLRPLGARSSH